MSYEQHSPAEEHTTLLSSPISSPVTLSAHATSGHQRAAAAAAGGGGVTSIAIAASASAASSSSSTMTPSLLPHPPVFVPVSSAVHHDAQPFLQVTHESTAVTNTMLTSTSTCSMANIFHCCGYQVNYVPRRYIVIMLAFIAVAINYSDRTNISVAVMEMAKELSWSQTQKGFVLSCFFIGYFLSGIPGGWLANRYGGKRIMAAAIFFWSAFTVLTPWAARSSFEVLCVIRIFLGAAEGLAWPSIHALIAVWIPEFELSRAVSLFTSGSYFGTVFTLLLAPHMISMFSWDSVFYFFGLLGIAFVFLWLYILSDLPETHPDIHVQEVAFIQAYRKGTQRNHGDDNGEIPWRAIFTAKQTWAFFLNMFASGWGFFVLLSWMPDFFQEEYNVDLDNVGWYSFFPYLGQGFVAQFSGFAADHLMIKFGFSLESTTSIMQVIGLLGPSVFLLLLGFTHTNALLASAYLTLALSLNATTCSGVSVYHFYIAPKYAGIVFSIGNTFAVLPGIVGVATTGSILDLWHSWSFVFALAVISYVIGVIIWLTMARDGRVKELSDDSTHLSSSV